MSDEERTELAKVAAALEELATALRRLADVFAGNDVRVEGGAALVERPKVL